MWILILAAVIVIALGFAVDRLGWYHLISGYNTMSKERQERVDIKKVARLIAWMCYGIGALFSRHCAHRTVWLERPARTVLSRPDGLHCRDALADAAL